MTVFPSDIYYFRSIRNFSDSDSSNPERRETRIPSGSRSVDSNLLSILIMWINVNFHPRNMTCIISKMYSGMSSLQYSFETTLMSYRSAVYLNDFSQSLFCTESYFLLYTMETIFAQLTTLYNMTLFLSFCTKVWWCFVLRRSRKTGKEKALVLWWQNQTDASSDMILVCLTQEQIYRTDPWS